MKTVAFIILTCCCKISYAQFTGGGGSGISVNNAIAISLSTPNTGWSGGSDDGFQVNTVTSLFMAAGGNGYTGGSGSGFKSSFSASQPVAALNTMFSGGKDDGFSSRLSVRSYFFVGTGNWDIQTNWFNNVIPPIALPFNSQIQVNPAGNTECILNVPQTILPGATITIMPGKKLRIIGNLIIQ